MARKKAPRKHTQADKPRIRVQAASIHFHVDCTSGRENIEADTQEPGDTPQPTKDWDLPKADAITESMSRLREAMLDNHVRENQDAKPKHNFHSPDDGEFSSHAKEAELAERKAATTAALRAEQDETWFEAVEAVCEKIGIFGACRWFLGAIGAGAGGATVVWAIMQIMGWQ